MGVGAVYTTIQAYPGRAAFEKYIFNIQGLNVNLNVIKRVFQGVRSGRHPRGKMIGADDK
jgi:hypothetical protein